MPANTQPGKAAHTIVPLIGLRLLLPALVPSWRFFDAVSASPRVDYAVLAAPDAPPAPWQELRPRPPVVGLGTMAGRLLWNAQWNESLFLVSLAERLASTPDAHTAAHSERELLLRVARHLHRQGVCGNDACLQIRLRFVSGAGDALAGQIAYVSAVWPMAALVTP